MSTLFTVFFNALLACALILCAMIVLIFFMAAGLAALWLPVRLLIDLVQLITKSRRNYNWQIAAAIMGLCALLGILWDYSTLQMFPSYCGAISGIATFTFWMLVIYGCGVLPSEFCVLVQKHNRFDRLFTVIRVVFAMPMIFIAMVAARHYL